MGLLTEDGWLKGINTIRSPEVQKDGYSKSWNSLYNLQAAQQVRGQRSPLPSLYKLYVTSNDFLIFVAK